LKLEEPTSHLLARVRGDSDPFNRWEAAQALSKHLILLPEPDPTTEAAYAEALSVTLSDARLDEAFRALMLNVPTESELAQIMSPVDPAFIHTRRKAFR